MTDNKSHSLLVIQNHFQITLSATEVGMLRLNLIGKLIINTYSFTLEMGIGKKFL